MDVIDVVVADPNLIVVKFGLYLKASLAIDVIVEGKNGIHPGAIPFDLNAVSSMLFRPVPKSTVENVVLTPKFQLISILPLPRVNAIAVPVGSPKP